VDFPAPFGPRITQRSPSERVNETGPRISLPERATMAFEMDATCAIGWQDYLRAISKCPKIAK